MPYGSSFFICTVDVLKFQTCSVTVPVATFLMAVICGTDKLRCDLFLNMLLVSVGVVISSYGEIHFNVNGTVYQVPGIFAEAVRLVLTQVLLQKKGLTLTVTVPASNKQDLGLNTNYLQYSYGKKILTATSLIFH